MTFAEKYPAIGLDGKNASWAGPAFRRSFAPLAETPMLSGKAYKIGVLPKGFDPLKIVVKVKTAATSGTMAITCLKQSDDSSAWTTGVTAANLAAVAQTATASGLPGPLTEDCDLIITANAEIADGEFSVEIAGYVFGVALPE